MQKKVYLRNEARYSDFDEIFDSQAICRDYWRLFAKQRFPATFGSHLEFLVNAKMRLSQKRSKMRDFDEISDPEGESTRDFLQKNVFPHFCDHLEVLCKTQKHVYLENGA